MREKKLVLKKEELASFYPYACGEKQYDGKDGVLFSRTVDFGDKIEADLIVVADKGKISVSAVLYDNETEVFELAPRDNIIGRFDFQPAGAEHCLLDVSLSV